MKNAICLLFFCATITCAFGQKELNLKKKSKFDYIFTISTQFGDIELILFDETPIHKENFFKLTKEGFYDSCTFHRVLDNFMIQGGDPNSKPNGNGRVGTGGPGYTLDAEFNTKFQHDKGMLAAARMPDRINKERKSSGSQFYIVQNEKGAHHLDGSYTIFGKVIKGIEVVDQIATQKVNAKGKPSEPIYMKVNYTRLKKKNITKMYGIEYPKKRK
ncbi:MAG: peptidylprolyl isomerase [Flammeovirgaceae bacterium]